MKTDAFHHHDHHRCVADALSQAESLCAERGVRLTPLRARVLELVWGSHQPLGAYQILDSLTEEGHKPAPPTVYRALEFLLEQGLIHRIASQNAFMGCSDPSATHVGYFLLCKTCGNAEEIINTSVLSEAINQVAGTKGFHIESQTVELAGQCQHCHQGHVHTSHEGHAHG